MDWWPSTWLDWFCATHPLGGRNPIRVYCVPRNTPCRKNCFESQMLLQCPKIWDFGRSKYPIFGINLVFTKSQLSQYLLVKSRSSIPPSDESRHTKRKPSVEELRRMAGGPKRWTLTKGLLLELALICKRLLSWKSGKMRFWKLL